MLLITKNELKAQTSKQNKKKYEKNINQTTVSVPTTTTTTNYCLNKNICQTSPNSKKLMNGKKYTYLFDN